MRTILVNEIRKERCNKAALGAFNIAIAAGATQTQAANIASEAVIEQPKPKASSKSGNQKDGSFIGTTYKQFGRKVEEMASQKNPGSVSLRNKDGSIRIKVEKMDRIYRVTRRYSDKDIRRHTYPASEFEKNYNHFMG